MGDTLLGRLVAMAEDVVQSAYKSFFGRLSDGQVEASSWDSLWGLLAVITARKCGRRVEYFHAARRNIAREVSPPAYSDDSAQSWEAIARDPTPAEAAVLSETIERLMQGLDERGRRILTLQPLPSAQHTHRCGICHGTGKGPCRQIVRIVS